MTIRMTGLENITSSSDLLSMIKDHEKGQYSWAIVA